MAGGMESHFFQALNLQVSKPEVWQKSFCLMNFRYVPENVSLSKIIQAEEMAVPYATTAGRTHPHTLKITSSQD